MCLEDPLSVISGTLPLWAVTLPRMCPCLFSLKTGKMLLKYTAWDHPSLCIGLRRAKSDTSGSSFKTVQTELNAQTDPRKMQELSQELSNIGACREVKLLARNFASTLIRLQMSQEFLRQSSRRLYTSAPAMPLFPIPLWVEDDDASGGSQQRLLCRNACC